MKHVIIGAGVAGVTAAQTIKEIDSSAEVVLIGEERFFPYKRYLLTEFLCGNTPEDELTYMPVEYFKEQGIQLRKGQNVKAINPAEKSIKLFHNEVMHYDKLLIATGGRPGLGPVLRPFREHIQPYYSLRDILVLKRRLPGINKCIVHGDGLSSLDLLRGLYHLGKQVTYIIKGERADFDLVESEFSGQLHEFLEEKGIEIITEDRVISIEKKNQHFQVMTLKQELLTADMVFAWDYYQPNIGFISPAETGIEKKVGILVNLHMRTSVEDIYAAGDCVEIYHPGVKNYWINFGWNNAMEQGTAAGKNMAGREETYKVHEAIVFDLMGKTLKARWWK
ncbi:MAG: FAD-dependent oxidoreductase [Candidatus Aminicenantes bacterium]|nr:FAD-dependent oxidoreductase [Candidatus Aminicenantes bacterium]NIM82372.1 FAD-dependent oxidoreductase [Candidatus Aminicenantes bacterium]NIN21762.1 FAD-dependent oxidoreductase [Candidatus Aminicenantes bacterium]NIN45562.1 FAD-dependent oxidoreductase [Candidatus Aminicenantes bacterium]NIN88395.1 FAD-dependent oxidoreductase [Candidatus Aminicenantes bacterium]